MSQQGEKEWNEAYVRERLVLKLGNLQMQKLSDENRKAELYDTMEFLMR